MAHLVPFQQSGRVSDRTGVGPTRLSLRVVTKARSAASSPEDLPTSWLQSATYSSGRIRRLLSDVAACASIFVTLFVILVLS